MQKSHAQDEQQNENEQLKDLFRGLERVTDIWLPKEVHVEHEGEAIALHNFRNAYLQIINGSSRTKGVNS